MKRYVKYVMALALLALVMPAQAHLKREQRGIWMSAYVSDWPSGKITADNANTYKVACQRMLDTMAVNNINVVYYHARAMCDAMYESAYEPWSSYIVETRGERPAFDPLQWIVQEGHKRGIEVYAWVNPYRYAPNGKMWGESERDYVNTHPEWLLTTSYETVLNPGIPEVRQRVVDVCEDIISKYDVDGLVFDDYFYPQGGTSNSLDADLYNAYKAGGGTLSQGDWRRENVNQMVADVQQMVQRVKPWVRFGIGPAGVACSAGDVAAKYGVDPSPGSDWQYNQIYSDPMAWVTRGTVDFISPQVYWNTNGNFDEVTGWWGKIAQKFNRHVYISQTCSNFGNDGWDLEEFTNQVDILREAGAQGITYFKYTSWRNNNGKIDGKTWALRRWLKYKSFTTPALMPTASWKAAPQTYGAVTNSCRIAGDILTKNAADTLRWDAIDNVRYVVYAIPDSVSDADFNCQPEYMLGFYYDNTYLIKPAYMTGYRFAVSVLDRWENEYTPVMVGSTATQADKPVLTSPANGDTVPLLSRLEWTTNGTIHTVQIYADEALTQQVASVEVNEKNLALTDIPGLTAGTFYWRVSSRGLNLYSNTSDVAKFTCESMTIQSPANGAQNVPLTPTVAWSKAADGTIYTLNISSKATVATPEFSVETTNASFQIPQYRLAGGTTYYAQVTAKLGDATDQSDVVKFTTLDKVPAAPVFITPAADEATLYGPQCISVQPEEGAQSLRVEICSTTAFSTRTSWRATLEEGEFSTEPLKDMTGSYSPADGKSYYVRARYAYALGGNTTVLYTDYSPVLHFNYVENMPGDVNGDGAINSSDVSAVVNAILSGSDDTIFDTNGDGVLNSSDVSALVNIILSN